MKRSCKHSYCLCVILGLTLLFTAISITAKAQNSTFSKPGKSIKYYPNGNSWDPYLNTTFTYNAAGQLTEEFQQYASSNQNFARFLTQYDASGNFKNSYGYYWYFGKWDLKSGRRDSLLYNGNKLSHKYTNHWNGNYRHWETLWTEYIYDSNNFLIQENVYFSDLLYGNWANHSKIVYKNDANGIIIQKQYYTFYSARWELLKTENYMSWHIPNVSPAVYTSLEIYLQRFNIQLGTNGSQTKITENFNYADSTWSAVRRETSTNDDRGNFINFKAENFNLTSGQWVVSEEYGQRHIYNNYFDITETTQYRFVPTSLGMTSKDEFKFVYSNFQYFGQSPDKVITSYPNPTTGILNFGLGDQEHSSLKVIILDLSGKTRLTRLFSAEEKKLLNIEALPTGVFMLQLQTEAGTTVKRIVKQ